MTNQEYYDKWDKNQVIEALISITKELDKQELKRAKLIKLLQDNKISEKLIRKALN